MLLVVNIPSVGQHGKKQVHLPITEDQKLHGAFS